MVSLEDGEQEIELGEFGINVMIEDRRDNTTKSTIQDSGQDDIQDKHTHDTLIEHVWKTGHKHDGVNCEECEAVHNSDVRTDNKV